MLGSDALDEVVALGVPCRCGGLPQDGDIGIRSSSPIQRLDHWRDPRMEAGDMGGPGVHGGAGVRGRTDGGDRFGEVQSVVDVGPKGSQQLSPGGEVKVEGAPADPCAAGDRFKGRCLRPVAGQLLPRRVEQATTGVAASGVLRFFNPCQALDATTTRRV